MEASLLGGFLVCGGYHTALYICDIHAFVGTPAQIARTDDSSVLNSDTSSRRKNTPNDQSMRRSIQDLVLSIDPNVKIEPDVEDVSVAAFELRRRAYASSQASAGHCRRVRRLGDKLRLQTRKAPGR